MGSLCERLSGQPSRTAVLPPFCAGPGVKVPDDFDDEPTKAEPPPAGAKKKKGKKKKTAKKVEDRDL